jgi:septum site-determining protein MinC
MSTSTDNHAVYDIKSADLPLVAFQLKTANLDAVAQGLHAQLQESPGFFDGDPVLIDLDGLPADAGAIDFAALTQLLSQHGLQAVAVKTRQSDWQQAARAVGLVQADDARVRRQAPAATVQMAPVAPPTPPAPAVLATPALSDALVLDKPLRSGQQLYAKGRDLIVLAMVNPGAEVIADGHIHIYAPLRGKAIAGARGFTGARIFAQSMDPELISIAGVYRTSENPLPADVRGLPAHVSLQSGADGDKLRIVALQN